MTPTDPVQVPKLAELMAANLREQMIAGRLRPGERLPSEQDLMNRYGASRPPVREALRVLENEDLVTVRRGMRGGAVASRPRPESLADRIATVAAVWDTDVDQLEALVQSIEVMALAGLTPSTGLRATDPDFHARVVAAGGGEMSAAVHAGLVQALDVTCSDANAHARVLRAVNVGDPDTVERAWRRHRVAAANARQRRGA